MNGEAEALDWIRAQREGWATGTRHSFAVLEPAADGGRLLGGAGLKHPANPGPSAEVGYWTAPEARGRSVAPRAVTALTAWAFTAFADSADSASSDSPAASEPGGPTRPGGLTRLDLLHQAGNAASCRVAHKCGYALDHVIPPSPPRYPQEGHVHVRLRAAGDAACP